MTYDDEISLIKYIPGENEMGDPIETPVKRHILASILDFRNKDFYQAMANGLKPSITFAVNKYEYENEQKLEHDGKLFRIIDVYPVKNNRYQDESEIEAIALICEGLVNH